jgi:hypothetical protein
VRHVYATDFPEALKCEPLGLQRPPRADDPGADRQLRRQPPWGKTAQPQARMPDWVGVDFRRWGRNSFEDRRTQAILTDQHRDDQASPGLAAGLDLNNWRADR